MAQKNLVLCLGQSNFVSTHPVEASLASKYALPRTDIEYNYWIERTSGSGDIEDAGSGTLVDLDVVGASSWFGPEISMAQRMVDVYGVENLVVVKVATGNTDLATDWDAGSTLMNKLYDYTQAVIAGIPDWRILGCVRMQGESDSNDATDSTNFNANLTAHFAELRNRFFEGYAGLPMIEGEIKKEPNGVATTTTINQVRAAQAAVCAADARAAMVATQDLSQVDETFDVHFDTAGIQTLGERMADALMNLVYQ